MTFTKDIISDIERGSKADKNYLIELCTKKESTVPRLAQISRRNILEYIMEYYQCSRVIAKNIVAHYKNMNTNS